MRKIQFVENSRKYLIISVILMALTLVCCLVRGVELDIQFRGGAILTYSYTGEVATDTFEQEVQTLLGRSASVQHSTDLATGGAIQTMVVTLPGNESLTSEETMNLNLGLIQAFPENQVESVSISNVDASIGSEFLKKSLVAVVLASVLLIIYVGIRFRRIGGVSAAIAAIIALLHDVIIAFAAFVIFGMALNDNFFAVILTIFGFSLNNTVVIYDRIRENKRVLGKNAPLREVVNMSINQSLTRSFNTTLTTLAALIVISVVAAIYGVTSIMSFSLPLIFGLISGTYTSLCIAGPLWVWWQERKAHS